MDDNLEIQGTRGTEGFDARGSRDPVPPPLETSIAQRSAPDLVLWSDELGGPIEPAQEEGKARGKSAPMGPNPAEKATHELTHVWCMCLRNWCSYCVRARASHDLHHRQPHKEPEFPIIMADYCFMQDSLGGELFTILDMLDVALGMMAAISVEEKGPSTYGVSAVVGDFPHRWRTSNSSTGRCNSIRQKRKNLHRMPTKVFLTIDGPG